ncbi:zinc protease [Catenulispora sp. GP43]|uniref:M16 family metallopeptidase n=1 Tax=Catenulispora sp. GP43 TaxID=3156263 RepID=UPI00351812AE
MTEVRRQPSGRDGFAWPIYESMLGNGLRVVVSPDPVAPIVAVNLSYDVGSRHEPPGRHGWAKLASNLMFEGSAHVAKGQHFEWVTEAGGAAINASSSQDRNNFYQVLPSSQLELALWLEADRMGGLRPTQESLDNQREVVKNERRQRYYDPPYGRWVEYALELTFPNGHPYQHPAIGTEAELDALTLQDIRLFHATYFVPNNAVLTVVGDAYPDQVIELAERYFGGIRAVPAVPPAPDGTLPGLKIGAAHRRVEHDGNVPRPMTFFMFRAPDSRSGDYPAVEVLAAVLGRGKGSRLWRKLVVEERLAQRENSYASSWNLAYGASAMFGMVSPLDGVEPADVEYEFVNVLDRLADGSVPISEPELSRAKALLASDWLNGVSEVGGRADLLAQYALLKGDPRMICEYLPDLAAVTAEDVHRVAALVLAQDNRVAIEYKVAPRR